MTILLGELSAKSVGECRVQAARFINVIIVSYDIYNVEYTAFMNI